MKACPECGNVSDSGAPMCDSCGYNFETGQSAERTRIDPTKVPRVLADETQPVSRRSSGRGAGATVALVAVVIAASAGFVILRVANSVDSARDRIDDIQFDELEVPGFEPPDSDLFEGPEFTRASCTREVGSALERLLRAQAKGKPLNDFFNNFTRFGIASFEYKTTLAVYSDQQVQGKLISEKVDKAVRTARSKVKKACRSEYPAG